MQHHILLVDDNSLHLASTREFLERRGFKVTTAQNGQQSIELLRALASSISLAVVDYQMPGKSGAETIAEMLKISPDLPVVALSGDLSREAVLHSTRAGARIFIDKNEGAEVFLRELAKLCRERELSLPLSQVPPTAAAKSAAIEAAGLIGASTALWEVICKAEQLSSRSGPVLILGDSGTGKELIARVLHGKRKLTPFIAVNCADFLLNKEMARSELFGHVRGAFTGAAGEKSGLFEQAADGTLFLDEIYALPVEAQMGLLRAIQERFYRRVGGNRDLPIRCRIIAAAKPDLLQEIARGQFKPDLFYRISQNIITIPRLSERREDIAPLVQHYVKQWCLETGERKDFLASTLPYLERYSWPGNVRELENFIFGTLNASLKVRISPEDLGSKFLARDGAEDLPLRPLREALLETEKRLLVQALEKSHSVAEAARHLGMASSNLLRSLKRFNLRARDYLNGREL